VAAKISLSSGAERASKRGFSLSSECVCSLVRSVCLEVGPGIFRACDAAGRARLSPRLPILISGGILFALLSTGKGAARALAGEHARMLSRSTNGIGRNKSIHLLRSRAANFHFCPLMGVRCRAVPEKFVICFPCSCYTVTSRSMPGHSFFIDFDTLFS